jgi:UDP-GlcNAc:undecaprenyl-phosphate GlcNAc-1-phosphate transferase
MTKSYILTAGIALVLSLAITPLVILISRRLRLFDPKSARKVHSTPIPRTGGVVIYLSVMAVLVWKMFQDSAFLQSFGPGQTKQFAAILASGSFIFLIGLLDDLRGLRALLKLAAQILAAVVVCGAGIRIGQIPQLGYLPLGVWDWPATIFWIVAVTNAVNLIDGLDGLAAGLSLMTCGVVAALAIYSQETAMGILMLAMVGSLVGFLMYNFNPAKIFLGDSGSMFLGFMLASLSLLTATKVATVMGIVLPMLFLGFPIFDMVISFLRRVLERRSPFSADREHIHHKLMDMGLKHHHAVMVLYVLTLLIAGLGVGMMLWRQEGELVILAVVLLALVGVYRLLGVVHFRRMWEQMSQNVERIREVNRERQDYETIRNRFRSAWDFEHWWRAVRRLARRLEFEEVTIHYTAENGEKQTRTYRRPESEQADLPPYCLTCSLQSKTGVISMEIKGLQSAPLETIGRRLTMLGRLLDEYPTQRSQMSEISGLYDSTVMTSFPREGE